MELIHRRLGARGERWSTPKGALEIRMPTVGVIVRRLEGYATNDLVEPAIQHLETVLAAGVRPIVFDDFELGVGYDSDCRVRITAWHAQHLGKLKEIHILVKSGLLAMGVSVTNLATGGAFRSYSDRSEFEWALANVLASQLTAGPPRPQTRAPFSR